tara:strand:+ start:499 stop:1314 length:816 start_codon:yes stop_codon:yes gene_type:complete
MALDKSGFILHKNLLEVLENIPNEKAGELFKHILKYVNDLDPQTDDLILKCLFIPIKQRLKADLDKWQSKKEGFSKAGLKSAEVRRKKKALSTNPIKQNTEKIEQFEKFWEVYNKKIDKKSCLIKWLKLKESDIKKIFETLENYVKLNDNIRFRKNPATYLNNYSWNDELTPIKKNNALNTTDKVINLFDNTDLTSTVKKYKSSKERLKERLTEFLEKEVIKAGFKNRQTSEVLTHFINSLEFNRPVIVKNIDPNAKAPWVIYAEKHNQND